VLRLNDARGSPFLERVYLLQPTLNAKKEPSQGVEKTNRVKPTSAHETRMGAASAVIRKRPYTSSTQRLVERNRLLLATAGPSRIRRRRCNDRCPGMWST
jgi:hypothetical protein